MVNRIGKFLLSLTLSAGVSISPPADAQNPDATGLADKMLERLGGRANWAALRNTINGSQQNRANQPTVVYAVITMDFERPRFRIETTAQDLHLIRVIDGENSWRLRGSGAIEDVPEQLFASEMQWYRAHLYRTIHRVAARDPALSLSIGADSRLEVFANDKRILWFKLDEKGEPYAFGAWEDNIGSLSGPWDFVKDGIHHPRWISSTDGTWRAAVKVLNINVPLHDSTFSRPKGD
jgi:hypothetical protein